MILTCVAAVIADAKLIVILPFAAISQFLALPLTKAIAGTVPVGRKPDGSVQRTFDPDPIDETLYCNAMDM